MVVGETPLFVFLIAIQVVNDSQNFWTSESTHNRCVDTHHSEKTAFDSLQHAKVHDVSEVILALKAELEAIVVVVAAMAACFFKRCTCSFQEKIDIQRFMVGILSN